MSSAMKKVLELLWSGSVQSRRFNVLIKNLALSLFNFIWLYYLSWLSWLILKIWWKVSFYNGNNSYSYVVYNVIYAYTNALFRMSSPLCVLLTHNLMHCVIG